MTMVVTARWREVTDGNDWKPDIAHRLLHI
jgi:hypothetical protein